MADRAAEKSRPEPDEEGRSRSASPSSRIEFSGKGWELAGNARPLNRVRVAALPSRAGEILGLGLLVLLVTGLIRALAIAGRWFRDDDSLIAFGLTFLASVFVVVGPYVVLKRLLAARRRIRYDAGKRAAAEKLAEKLAEKPTPKA